MARMSESEGDKLDARFDAKLDKTYFFIIISILVGIHIVLSGKIAKMSSDLAYLTGQLKAKDLIASIPSDERRKEHNKKDYFQIVAILPKQEILNKAGEKL